MTDNANAACYFVDGRGSDRVSADFLGALKSGVVPLPLNILLTTAIYEAILSYSSATILFVSSELWPIVEPATEASPYLRQIVAIGSPVEGTVSFERFLEGAETAAPIDVAADEVAFWLYSPGSTGVPKGVRRASGNSRYLWRPGSGPCGNGQFVFCGKAILCLWSRQRHDLSNVGRRHGGVWVLEPVHQQPCDIRGRMDAH